jgi:hypothetical protein
VLGRIYGHKESGWRLEKMAKVELHNLFLCKEHKKPQIPTSILKPLLS